MENSNLLQDFKESCTYIFEHENWIARTWPIFLVPFIPVFGVLGIFLLKGWRFEMVRNFAFERNELPKVDIGLWLKRGFLLWGALIVYLMVPWLLCRLIGVSGILDLISDINLLFQQGIGPFLKDYASDLTITLIIYGVWGLIAAPTLQCGMVRYALSGNWKYLFSILPNFYFVVRNLFMFMKFFLMWLLFLLTVFIADFILTVTFFGAILIPLITITFFYVTTAHELGELALKIRKLQESSEPATSTALSPEVN